MQVRFKPSKSVSIVQEIIEGLPCKSGKLAMICSQAFLKFSIVRQTRNTMEFTALVQWWGRYQAMDPVVWVSILIFVLKCYMADQAHKNYSSLWMETNNGFCNIQWAKQNCFSRCVQQYATYLDTWSLDDSTGNILLEHNYSSTIQIIWSHYFTSVKCKQNYSSLLEMGSESCTDNSSSCNISEVHLL